MSKGNAAFPNSSRILMSTEFSRFFALSVSGILWTNEFVLFKYLPLLWTLSPWQVIRNGIEVRFFKIACFVDHDFSLEFPSRQRSQLAHSTVRINGDKDIDALTICLWLKSSLESDFGLLRYFDEAGSDVYFALRLGSGGQIWLSIHGEDR